MIFVALQSVTYPVAVLILQASSGLSLETLAYRVSEPRGWVIEESMVVASSLGELPPLLSVRFEMAEQY